MDLKQVIEDSFSIYAAATIQNRAIVDARDCLKPSARMCFYAQKLEKIDSKHSIQPSPTSVGAALKYFYTHGDSSCYGLLARYGKEYVSRYILEDFHGSTGSLIENNSEAASRYTKMRLNELGDRLFDSLEKDTIDIWFDNFSNTEKYPSVLPSLGFYNIVNGTVGIATGLSSSIPEFNLKEVNRAMIKLLWNPDVPFDEIYCPPDFVGGATIVNANDVKESLENGQGKSICLRSSVEYDEKENCLIVSEIPFGVYTNTICREISALVEVDPTIKINKVLDLTKKTPNIKIFLGKNSNWKKILLKLYKHTSLQSYFSVNMTMLDNGTRPRVFSWREALQAHLDHEKVVRTKAHKYDVLKISERLHIVEGILTAIANIDELVGLIRSSDDKTEAASKLMERFGYSDSQVEAILKMTLSKLINLELQSYKDEKEKLLEEKLYHESVLKDQELLYKEIEKDLKEVAEKYGDERRTKLINLDFTSENEEEAEPIEKRELLIHYTNLNNLYTQESTTLLTSRRGGKGKSLHLAENEVVLKTISDNNFSSLLAFTNTGKMYSVEIDELPINSKINTNIIFNLAADEKITALTSISRNAESKYFTFITKNGMIKKTKSSEYTTRRGKGIKAINLKDNDEVINVLFTNSEKVGILTLKGNFVIIDSDDINPIGRATAGVRAIKLDGNNRVIRAKIIKDDEKTLLSLSKSGLIKKTSIDEFPLCNRGIKGKRISGTKENDLIVDFLTFSSDCDIIINTNRNVIKINTEDLRTLSREALGVKSITLSNGDFAKELIR